MDIEDVAPVLGVAGCLALLVVLGLPYLLVEAPGQLLGDYYAAGPVGAGALVFFALIAVVVFAAGRKGRTDPDVAAGIALVLGVAAVAVAVVWALGIDDALLFSFPPEADWIEYHPWAVVAASLSILAAGGLYAREAV